MGRRSATDAERRWNCEPATSGEVDQIRRTRGARDRAGGSNCGPVVRSTMTAVIAAAGEAARESSEMPRRRHARIASSGRRQPGQRRIVAALVRRACRQPGCSRGFVGVSGRRFFIVMMMSLRRRRQAAPASRAMAACAPCSSLRLGWIGSDDRRTEHCARGRHRGSARHHERDEHADDDSGRTLHDPSIASAARVMEAGRRTRERPAHGWAFTACSARILAGTRINILRFGLRASPE